MSLNKKMLPTKEVDITIVTSFIGKVKSFVNKSNSESGFTRIKLENFTGEFTVQVYNNSEDHEKVTASPPTIKKERKPKTSIKTELGKTEDNAIEIGSSDEDVEGDSESNDIVAALPKKPQYDDYSSEEEAFLSQQWEIND